MLTCWIDGVAHDRAAVHAWEDKRTRAVRKVLGLPPSTADRMVQRAELIERKLALGHDGLMAQLGRGIRWSERSARLAVALSGSKRRTSVCEIVADKGSAAAFAAWFDERNTINDEQAMIAACPDHYIIARDAVGRQLVVETTGGSPLPTRFTVDYADVSTLQTPSDPAFPEQVAGVARLDDGRAIGGVRHQFRDEGEGFRARLTVEFPGLFPGSMAGAHQWHLACEFSNWIEAAAA